MDYLQIDELPALRKPTFIAAFRGWNDAGEAGTGGVRHMIDAWSAQEFAHIDPEEFFDFTVARPRIAITEEGLRDLSWPSNRFFYHRHDDEQQPDAVLLLGTEPHLRWRAFTDTVRDLYERMDGERLLTLGALVAATTHTRPVPVTGFSTEADLQQRLQGLTIGRSRYEGPTGIVGALHAAWREDDLAAGSLWAGLPPYLGDAVNPRGALALLQELDRLFAFVPDLAKLEEAAQAFEREVEEALESNEEMRSYLGQLEKRLDSGATESGALDLPSAGDLMGDLETFLRQQRKD